MRDVAPPPAGRMRCYRVCNFMPVKGWLPLFRHPLEGFCARRYGTPGSHWTPSTGWTHNDILYEWGAIVAPLLLRQGLNYGIGGMYLEFENVADPASVVALPAVSRDASQGIGYYNGLASSPDRDYLRVPLTVGLLDKTDPIKFPNGNVATFFAQTSGVQGVHGKPFSDANNSKVYGGALVAFVDKDDFTRDLVYARSYLAAGDQQVKLPTSQIGLEWQQILG
jgi:hypothetical protein